MEKQELIDRINKYFEQPIQKTDAHLNELNLLYFHTTGVMLDCKPCQYVERRKQLKFYLANPTRVFTLNPTITITTMATKNQKYRLTDPKLTPTIRLGRKDAFVNITNETLTDAQAEQMLANDKYKHLIEPNPAYVAPEEEAQPKGARTKRDSE